MAWKHKLRGGIVTFVGFMLSPLSWWNDAFVNLPLALGFAWLVALVYKPSFEAALVVGYWLTNIIGLVLLHRGMSQTLSKDKPMPYTRRELVRDLVISLAYTGVVLVLVKLKVLLPVSDYFQKR
jgi:hypothetical protein